MSTNECDNVLAHLINTIVNHEKQVEEIKVELANNQQFSPFSTFRRINTSETGFLTDEDMESFLKYYGFSVSKQDLKRLLTSEKQKTSRITYNDFLTQVLPTSDIDLRNEVLQRADSRNVEITDTISRDIGRLITAIYQKEIEYLRMLDVDKKKLLKYDIALVDVAFLCLADDIIPFLAYKSISSFMKQNGFHFGKTEFECFMRRVDKGTRGRVSVADFKYILFPFKSLMEANLHLNGYSSYSQTKPTIEGISPIKSVKASPTKNNTSYDSRNQRNSANQRNPGDSILKNSKNSFSPARYQEDENIDVKIPAGKPRISQPASQVTFNDERNGAFVSMPSSRQNFYTHHNKNIYQTDQYMPASSRQGFYNQEIAAIQDNLAYQNVPGTSCAEINTRNPLENRFLDPAYHSYWGYSRQHNATLSPEYLNKGKYNLKTTKNVPSSYYNPNFLEPGSYENNFRYPDNPFRHTDHGHYFQNYYNGLRSNYYDQYYNFVPYQTKVSMSKSQSSANKSRNSPAKSNADHNENQFRSEFSNQPNQGLFQLHQVPEQENSFKKSPPKYRNSSTVPVDLRSSSHSSAYQPIPLPEYQVFSQSQSKFNQYEDSQPKRGSAIKIDSQEPQRNLESAIDSFLINQPPGDIKPETPDDVESYDDKPYKYVIVHG